MLNNRETMASKQVRRSRLAKHEAAGISIKSVFEIDNRFTGSLISSHLRSINIEDQRLNDLTALSSWRSKESRVIEAQRHSLKALLLRNFARIISIGVLVVKSSHPDRHARYFHTYCLPVQRLPFTGADNRGREAYGIKEARDANGMDVLFWAIPVLWQPHVAA